MAETYSVSFLVLEAMMSSRTVSFVLRKCRKIAISVFNFDHHMFVNLMINLGINLMINLGILLLMKHEPKRAICERTFHKAIQLLLQSYSKSCRVLVNHIKRIQWMVREICKAIVIHCTPTDHIVEQQERYSKYSQQAIGFAISTYSGFLVSSESHSTGDTVIKIATSAAFFVAIIADLVSWRMKPRWGRALVYISSFHLLLMTFVIFVSFDKDYGYPIILVLLITIAAILLQRTVWPAGVWQQSMDDDTAISQDLDFMFELSSLILNLDGMITMFITISGHFPSGVNKYEAAKTAGFLFFCTIVLSLYLMMVATVRTVTLTVSSKYFDVLLMVLLVSTLIATSITFVYFFDQTLLMEWEVPT